MSNKSESEQNGIKPSNSLNFGEASSGSTKPAYVPASFTEQSHSEAVISKYVQEIAPVSGNNVGESNHAEAIGQSEHANQEETIVVGSESTLALLENKTQSFFQKYWWVLVIVVAVLLFWYYYDDKQAGNVLLASSTPVQSIDLPIASATSSSDMSPVQMTETSFGDARNTFRLRR